MCLDNSSQGCASRMQGFVALEHRSLNTRKPIISRYGDLDTCRYDYRKFKIMAKDAYLRLSAGGGGRDCVCSLAAYLRRASQSYVSP